MKTFRGFDVVVRDWARGGVLLVGIASVVLLGCSGGDPAPAARAAGEGGADAAATSPAQGSDVTPPAPAPAPDPAQTNKDAGDANAGTTDAAAAYALVLKRAPIKLFEKNTLQWSVDAEGKVITPAGTVAGTFAEDGTYTRRDGSYGMGFQPDGTLLRDDRTPFLGKLDAKGNYVQGRMTWSFGDDGTVLLNGRDVGGARMEGLTPETRVFAMVFFIGLLHPGAASIIYP